MGTKESQTGGEQWKLMAKVLSGQANDQEVLDLKDWIKDPQNASVWETTQKFWSVIPEKTSPIEIDKAFQQVRDNLHQFTQSPTITPSFVWKMAASFLLLVGFSGLLYFFMLSENPERLVLKSEQQRLEYLLPDGSTVYLGVNSQLEYQADFNKIRTLSLTGKAYFNVAHDKQSPFSVHTGSATVTVLGTSFQVTALANGKPVKVTVESGKVELRAVREKNQRVILKAGYEGIYNPQSGQVVGKVNQNQNYDSWKTGKMVFEDTPLAEVIQILSSVYQTSLKLENPDPGNCLLTAEFDQQTLENILEILTLTFDLQTKTYEGGIIINGKSC